MYKKNITALTLETKKRTADTYTRTVLLLPKSTQHYSTQKLAAMRNQSDRNIHGVRSTVLGQIEKKVLLVLADRLGQDFPFTGEKQDFLSRYAKDLPTVLEKLDKEKIALIKKNWCYGEKDCKRTGKAGNKTR